MDCITLGNDIAKTSLVLNGFVREVREARADVDGISRELHSLQSVLNLLKEDTELFPTLLAAQTPTVLDHCCKVVEELDDCFSSLNRGDLSRQEKRKLWAARGRKASSRFRPALEAHRAIIGLALDLVEAYVPYPQVYMHHTLTAIWDRTTIRDATSTYDIEGDETDEIGYGYSTIEDISRIIGELGSLRMRLAKEFERRGFESALHEYMMSLKNYAEAIISGTEEEYTADQGAYMGENELFGAYVGDSPDSAIGLYNEPVVKTLKDAIARNAEYGIHPIDDIIEEESTGSPSRPPTPPPKDVKRLELARRSMILPAETPTGSPTDSHFGAVTEFITGSQESSQESSQGSASPPTPKSSRFSKILGSVRKNSSERPATAAANYLPGGGGGGGGGAVPGSRPSADVRPSTPVLQGSLVRRGSRRLSVTFKKLPMWNVEIDQLLMGTDESTDGAVFGVPLQKSIQVAKGTAKTHHSGGGRASRREYPLCIQKSCLYIKQEGGVEAPGIFAEPGDPRRVQQLKEAFSRAPAYGDDVDWDRFGVHDAADLVLLFLAQLPKPLVSESAARRWVSLSRQALVAGSRGTRWEQCIDFWEEALGAIRGPARSLFKLLLNLWADVAAAAEHNDMTAERLAACVLKPLMHVSSEKHETDFILALAFLIRKRTEYVDMLRMDQKESKRISRAAW